MAGFKKYRLNPETLLYEIEKVSMRTRVGWALVMILAGAAMCVLYLWLYTSVLGMELPKTMLLKKKNAEWVSKLELMNKELDGYDAVLEGLATRDDKIYRNIFGMNEISSEVRNAGFGGVNRYAFLDGLGDNSLLKKTEIRMDKMLKKTYVQSKSFDEVAALSQQAGDRASHIPAVIPMAPDGKFRVSSPFGYRTDPLNGTRKMHSGFDFACNPGNPVYASGDGTVVKVAFELFGYGNSIIIDHGFGYKTRYAHLKSINVTEGMEIKRGECIGYSGNSGRSSGPHLHYEVIYKDNCVNPYNYFDLEIPLEEFREMTRKAEAESKYVLTTHQKVKR